MLFFDPLGRLDGLEALRSFLLEVAREVEELNQLPSLFHNIGLALLSILIPLAIAILGDVYQKKKDKNEDFVGLDLQVILDDVFQIRRLVVFAILMFLPFILWENSSGFLRIGEMALSLIGIYFVIRTILNVYRWTKGDVFTFRFSYLENLEKSPDFEVAWKSVWSSKEIDMRSESRFFDIFSSKVGKVLKQHGKNVSIVPRLLFDFSNSIDKRSVIFLVNKFLPKVLDWKLTVWKFSLVASQEREKKDERIRWFGLEHILNEVFRKIGERALEPKQLFSALFLQHFKDHVQAHGNEEIMIKNKERYYIEDLFRLFYQLVFEKVSGSDESLDFWSSFPLEWKVTKNNLLDEKNLIARISCRAFIDWALNRIQSGQTFDRQLNDVSNNLFPEVHPEMWAMVLIFVFSPYSSENRVKSVVERPWTFGFILRPVVFFGEKKPEEIIKEQKAQEESEIQNTYELTHLLFPAVFTEELLKEYIKQAGELKYPDDSTENHRKAKLLELFSGLLASLKKG
jgi:hypothetical protein